MRHRRLAWNGNEIVFEDAPNVGIAGIAPGQPDELARLIVQRWNDAEPCEDCRESPATCPGVDACNL